MKRKIRSFAVMGVIVAMLVIPVLGNVIPALADSRGLTLSPMNEKLVLNPGDSTQSSFTISNPMNSTATSHYEIHVEPFYIGNDGKVVTKADGDLDERYAMMADWIEFDVPTKGSLEPNGASEVKYTINVPKNAPAGGQYATITVTSSPKEEQGQGGSNGNSSNGATIEEKTSIGHLIYAEVAGNTVKSGDIMDANVPSFLLDGSIKGSATVKNTGNVHGEAKFTLKVFPLFSSEEVYTNEEDPSTKTILPDREYYAETAWEDTPGIGIFNVVYTVEFQGESQEVSKMVIKAPIWLLFLIVLVIVLIAIGIVLKVKGRSRARARSSQE